jgi:hypothetical protein
MFSVPGRVCHKTEKESAIETMLGFLPHRAIRCVDTLFRTDVPLVSKRLSAICSGAFPSYNTVQ